MSMVDEKRRNTEWSINQNPVTISITRTEKARSGGGFTEVITTLGPYTVRIFPQKSSIPQNVSSLAGTKQVDKSWGMLLSYTADIKADAKTKDEFDAPSFGHFEVKGVYPQITDGEVTGYQADLEKVS